LCVLRVEVKLEVFKMMKIAMPDCHKRIHNGEYQSFNGFALSVDTGKKLDN